MLEFLSLNWMSYVGVRANWEEDKKSCFENREISNDTLFGWWGSQRKREMLFGKFQTAIMQHGY